MIYTLSERKIITPEQACDKLIVLKEHSWISRCIIDLVLSWYE
jgi:hypothetical protein